MKIIKLENGIIYRADKGKKVKFEKNNKPFSEISVDKNDNRKVEEVDDGNL